MRTWRWLSTVVLASGIAACAATAMDITYLDLTDKISTLKRSSLSIQALAPGQDITQSQPMLLGSGFMVIRSGVNYVVTNAHVVRACPTGHTLVAGANTAEGKVYVFCSPFRTDENVDLAILSMGKGLFSHTRSETTTLALAQSAVGISMFADSTDTREGMGVLSIGYPLAIGSDHSRNSPVSRLGMIAQFTGGNTFLVDGIASKGNSGSLVFNVQTNKLVGIVVGFPPDFIQAYDENGAPVAKLPYNSGLTLCSSAAAIRRLLP